MCENIHSRTDKCGLADTNKLEVTETRIPVTRETFEDLRCIRVEGPYAVDERYWKIFTSFSTDYRVTYPKGQVENVLQTAEAWGGNFLAHFLVNAWITLYIPRETTC